MKKKMILALATIFVMSVAGTAFAGPFADVPAKHWSYDAVNKLAAAGIVDGYGDGTFRGDKTITRYEMAQIVAKAMEHEDKADAANKALIKKLVTEYSQELDNLGVRVTKLENRIGNITFSGQVREWYQWRDSAGADKTGLNTRLLLFMNAPMTDEITFKGRLWAESGWGESSNTGTGADASMDQAYLVGTHGNTTWTLGRQGIELGQGLVYAWFPNNDGATVTVGSDKVKLTAAAFRNQLIFTAAPDVDINVLAGNLAVKASKDLDLTAVYTKTKSQDLSLIDTSLPAGTNGDLINTWALGANYRGIDNINLTAEYGRNDSDAAKALKGDNTAAKAWVAQAKYKGADFTKPHSYGLWVGYRKAENGFLGRNGDYVWETPTNILDTYGYLMNNVKGTDFGIDYTIFNNAVLTLQYFDLKDEVTGDVNKKSAVAQLRYMF